MRLVLAAIAFFLVDAQQECMQQCMQNFLAVAQRKELRPLYVVTTDVSLDEARRNMNEVCGYVKQGLDCMRGCQNGQRVVSVMEKSGQTDMCIKRKDDFLRYALKCEVENRDEIKRECGVKTLERYVMILQNLKNLLKEVARNPLKAETDDFRNEFGEVCEYSGKVAQCTMHVYNQRCSREAQELTMGLLKKNLGSTSPAQLGRIHEKCRSMAQSLATIEASWENRTPRPSGRSHLGLNSSSTDTILPSIFVVLISAVFYHL